MRKNYRAQPFACEDPNSVAHVRHQQKLSTYNSLLATKIEEVPQFSVQCILIHQEFVIPIMYALF